MNRAGCVFTKRLFTITCCYLRLQLFTWRTVSLEIAGNAPSWFEITAVWWNLRIHGELSCLVREQIMLLAGLRSQLCGETCVYVESWVVSLETADNAPGMFEMTAIDLAGFRLTTVNAVSKFEITTVNAHYTALRWHHWMLLASWKVWYDSCDWS